MLETALISSPIDHKVTALMPTQNPLKVIRKPTRDIWYRQQIFIGAQRSKGFLKKAAQQISQ